MIRRFHYSWIICIGGLMLTFLTMGMVNNGFSVILPYLRDQYGFSNTQTSMLVDIRCGATFIGMFLVGAYYRKVYLRIGTAAAAYLVAVAFGIYTFAGDHYYLYCIGTAVAGIAYGLGSMIPVSILMNNWFRDSVSLAIGIAASGSGLATIILPPIVTTLIQKDSIQNAFSFESFLGLVIGSLILIMMRSRPIDVGLRPYVKEKKEEIPAVTAVPAKTSKDREVSHPNPGRRRFLHPSDEKKKTRPVMIVSHRVWIYLVIASFIMGVLASPAVSHLPFMFAEGGFSPARIAFLMSYQGAFLTASKILLGRVADKIGIYRSFMIFGSITMIAMLLISFTRSGSMVTAIAGCTLLGIGISTATIAIPCWARDFASEKNYGRIVSRLQILYALGALVCTGMPGILADLTGSYVPAYLVFTAAVGIALLMIFLSYHSPKRDATE